MGFELRFADKEITAWGGMGLMKRMFDRIGFQSAGKQVGYRSRAITEAMRRFNCFYNSCCQYGVVRIGLSIRR
jgi:hypothetical protein